ncbi:unnamed protein product, partial [Tilletia laevis]
HTGSPFLRSLRATTHIPTRLPLRTPSSGSRMSLVAEALRAMNAAANRGSRPAAGDVRQRNDPDMDADGDDDHPEVRVANPHAHTFLATYPLSQKGLRMFVDMIQAFESRAIESSLEMHTRDPDEPDAGLFEHAVRKKRRRAAISDDSQEESFVWVYYFAPLDQVYTFGVLVKAADDQQATEVNKLVEGMQSMQRQLSKLVEKDRKQFNEEAVINVAALFFYSGAVADYSAGEGTLMLEKAAMAYLRNYPHILGHNGKNIMQPGGLDVQKKIKAVLSAKWTNLRNHLKEELHASTGKESGTEMATLLELTFRLFKGYRIPITEHGLRRICVLRWCALEYSVRTEPTAIVTDNPPDGEPEGHNQPRTRWEINPLFWQKTSTFMRSLTKDFYNPDNVAAVIEFHGKVVEDDKDQFGHYEFEDDPKDRADQKKVDKYLVDSYVSTLRVQPLQATA